MSINQNQIRDLSIATATAAASVGRPNEIAHIVSLNGIFKYVVDSTLSDNGSTTVAANGTNAHWVMIANYNSGLKNNVPATARPSVSDDSSTGYGVGSIWTYPIAFYTELYTCVDATIGAAIWVRIDENAPTNSVIYVTTTFPDSTYDSTAGYAAGSLWYSSKHERLYMCVSPKAGNASWTHLDVSAKLRSTFVSPTTSDNTTLKYKKGDLWHNVLTNALYICTNADTGIWTKIVETDKNKTSTVDPTVTDDTSFGISVGSRWVNTTTNHIFFCTDSTVGAAVWVDVTSGSAIKNNFAATAAPSGSNDGSAAQGYSIGSVWIDVTNDKVYTCVDATTGAAIWKETSPVNASVSIKDQLNGGAAPTAANDSSAAQGYSVGSVWVDVTNQNSYICISAAANAAVWKLTTSAAGPKDQLNGGAAPTASNDSSVAQGYSIGSVWIDVTNQNSYICISAAPTAAVWKLTTSAAGPKDQLNGGAAPTAANDSSAAQGYSIGSVWIDVTNQNSYICISAAPTAAVWKLTTSTAGPKDQLNGGTAPTAANDSSAAQGYSVGSVWVDVTNQNSYICISATTNAAVWKLTTSAVGPKNQFNGVAAPTVTNDGSAAQGYSIGSVWIDVTNDKVYTCVDATTGAAIWKDTSIPVYVPPAKEFSQFVSTAGVNVVSTGGVVHGTWVSDTTTHASNGIVQMAVNDPIFALNRGKTYRLSVQIDFTIAFSTQNFDYQFYVQYPAPNIYVGSIGGLPAGHSLAPGTVRGAPAEVIYTVPSTISSMYMALNVNPTTTTSGGNIHTLPGAVITIAEL